MKRHINICYDLELTWFECGAEAVPPVEIESQQGDIFTVVTARIFTNAQNQDCDSKLGFFFTDWPETPDADVLLDFGDDPTNTVTGRLDITKNFGSPPFADLRYLHDALSGAVDVNWCNLRLAVDADKIDGPVGDEKSPFHDVLGSVDYPTLDGVLDVDPDPETEGEDGEVAAIACKVYEEEDAAGVQWNVIYFEFLDPNFF